MIKRTESSCVNTCYSLQSVSFSGKSNSESLKVRESILTSKKKNHTLHIYICLWLSSLGWSWYMCLTHTHSLSLSADDLPELLPLLFFKDILWDRIDQHQVRHLPEETGREQKDHTEDVSWAQMRPHTHREEKWTVSIDWDGWAQSRSRDTWALQGWHSWIYGF